MTYKYITKAEKILILTRSDNKNISVSVHIFKINILFFAMQNLSKIKLWVTGKVESSEVETNSLIFTRHVQHGVEKLLTLAGRR